MEIGIGYPSGMDYRRNYPSRVDPKDDAVTLLVRPDRTVQLIPNSQETVVFEAPKQHVP